MVHVDKKVYSKGFRVIISSITDDCKTATGLFYKTFTAVIDDLAWYARATPAQRIFGDCCCIFTKKCIKKFFM
jgi:hypothetical protein